MTMLTVGNAVFTLNAELAHELSLVFLGLNSKSDHNMRFGGRKHGGPTGTEMAVKMYERRVLLLDVVGTRRVYGQKFHWIGTVSRH
jgi:hypothetical protein